MKEIFNSYDKEEDGFIVLKNILPILKSLGLEYTEESLCNMIANVVEENNGLIDFPDFLALMELIISNQGKEEKCKVLWRYKLSLLLI